MREGEASLSLNKWDAFFKWLPWTEGPAAVHGVAKSQTRLSDWTEPCAWKHFNTWAQASTGRSVLFSFDPHKSHLRYRLSFPFYRGGNWDARKSVNTLRTTEQASEGCRIGTQVPLTSQPLLPREVPILWSPEQQCIPSLTESPSSRDGAGGEDKPQLAVSAIRGCGSWPCHFPGIWPLPH